MSAARFDLPFDDARALRCQVCGDVIGQMWGDDPPAESVVLRCYACAATEAAEAITEEASR